MPHPYPFFFRFFFGFGAVNSSYVTRSSSLSHGPSSSRSVRRRHLGLADVLSARLGGLHEELIVADDRDDLLTTVEPELTEHLGIGNPNGLRERGAS